MIDAEKVMQWGEAHVSVQDASSGGIVPFKRNDVQLDFTTRSKALRGHPVADYPVKPRQVGLSTCNLIYMLGCCVLYPGWTALWVSQDEPNARAIRRKFRKIYTSAINSEGSGIEKDDLISENAAEFTLKNGSCIVFAYCGEDQSRLDNIGRGDTLNFACFTEVAYWKDADRVYRSLRPGLEKARAPIVYDSTPNGTYGPGEWFYRRVESVRSGRLPGNVYFWPWWKDKAYYLPAVHDADFIRQSLTPREQWLINEHGLNLHQIKWRRHQIADVANDDEEVFLEIYPETYEQAWRRPAKSIFKRSILRKLAARIAEGKSLQPLGPEEIWASMPESVRDPRGIGLDIIATPPAGDPRWSSKIYRLPCDEEAPYAIGVDASQGLPDGDAQSLTVTNRDAQICARLHSRIPDIMVLSGHYQRLATWYNGVMDIEDASTGPEISIYLSSKVDEDDIVEHMAHPILRVPYRTNKVPTTQKTRPIYISKLLEYLQGMITDVDDQQILDEMFMFAKNDKGKIEAVEGYYDDALLSLGISLRLRERLLTTSRIMNVTEEKYVPGGYEEKFAYISSGPIPVGPRGRLGAAPGLRNGDGTRRGIAGIANRHGRPSRDDQNPGGSGRGSIIRIVG